MIFIGIDLAWSDRNKTGLAAVRWHADDIGMTLFDVGLARTDDQIVEWIQQWDNSACILSIDAPIIAPNDPGTMRDCDRAVTRVFGRYHAGTYPANRVRCARPIRLRCKLEPLGFSAYPHLRPRARCRRQLEIFPHPAHVVFFKRDRIIKYKKGTPDEKRQGLTELVANIRQHLPSHTPALLPSAQLDGLLCKDIEPLRGSGMKSFEDQLDALLCAYTAGFYWYWGKEKCTVFGNRKDGYILCPDPEKCWT